MSMKGGEGSGQVGEERRERGQGEGTQRSLLGKGQSGRDAKRGGGRGLCRREGEGEAREVPSSRQS